MPTGVAVGTFTLTELAAVTSIYAFAITKCIYRDYCWRHLPLLVGRVVRTVSIVPMVIVLLPVTYLPELTLWLPWMLH